jgi:hypothetical protein
MSKFRIQSHGRLQEWVAEERGYFKDAGLDYEFLVKPIVTWAADVKTVESAPGDIQRGAFVSLDREHGGFRRSWKNVGACLFGFALGNLCRP